MQLHAMPFNNMLACKMVLLFQPSSTAAERVFFISRATIYALEDYIETSIMLQFMISVAF